MDNLSWGNPLAHRVRVKFNTASAIIYEGMPVCYNYDTTVNWAGGSVARTGEITASATLTAGTPETAASKYLEVENPADGNIQWFAGVVARGGWVGKTVSATAGVGLLLDIYVPNGAIVPVRAGVDCTIGRTVLSVIAATQYLGHALDATEARPVAITEETVARSTAGLILAKLDPNMFIYQDATGSSLYVGVGATAPAVAQVVNRINLSTAQTAGQFSALRVYANVESGGSPESYDYGLAAYFQSTYKDGSTIRSCTTVGVWMNIDSGADVGVGTSGHISAIQAGIYQAGDDPWAADQTNVSVLQLNLQIEDDPGNNCLSYIRMRNDGAHAIDGVFHWATTGGCGLTGAAGIASTHKMPLLISGTVYYFMISSTGV